MGYDQSCFLGATLVDSYGKFGFVGEARNMVSWTTIIVGYGRRGDGKEAIKLLKRMLREDFIPDELTLASVLSSCGNLSVATEVIQSFSSIKAPDLFSWTSMIGAYASHGFSKEAIQLFEEMLVNGIVSNWPDAALIWEMARERLHNKSPGCSMEIARGINTIA
ncbi:hypothetical protein K7X08_036041 [Anisodus acutangulus]|uniref:Pentatricopeptide repeat-containing protein n=1 Tax=Anisodus acutangulus TaxID=402998 RepID=A0A9Q1L7W2_9SOLA|nr:hypothetical protein K7X08_036041 [Anisodus acutangulus]